MWSKPILGVWNLCGLRQTQERKIRQPVCQSLTDQQPWPFIGRLTLTITENNLGAAICSRTGTPETDGAPVKPVTGRICCPPVPLISRILLHLIAVPGPEIGTRVTTTGMASSK